MRSVCAVYCMFYVSELPEDFYQVSVTVLNIGYCTQLPKNVIHEICKTMKQLGQPHMYAGMYATILVFNDHISQHGLILMKCCHIRLENLGLAGLNIGGKSSWSLLCGVGGGGGDCSGGGGGTSGGGTCLQQH